MITVLSQPALKQAVSNTEILAAAVEYGTWAQKRTCAFYIAVCSCSSAVDKVANEQRPARPLTALSEI